MISTRSREFLDPILNALHLGKELVVWYQIPWTGGGQDWYLIRSEKALLDVLNRGRVASAFTIYEWIPARWSSVVDQAWLLQASASLSESDHDLLLLVEMDSDPLAMLTWMGELDILQEWYEHNLGSQVSVMRMPWSNRLSDGTIVEEIVRGYFPDAEGNPRSGAY